jgi:hypothetical protein
MTDTFVVDNSVVMSWCFKDETNQYADAVLDKSSYDASYLDLAMRPENRLSEWIQ